MWTDTHAHLYGFSDAELEQIILRARQNGVDHIINSATNISTAIKVCEQAAGKNTLYATVGISPFDVEDVSEGWRHELQDLLFNRHVIGIGEIGLDNSNPRYPSLEKQIPVFDQQLALAAQSDKPVILHSRGAELQVLARCKELHITKAVFHCFTGSPQVLDQILDTGYFVSYSGIITFTNNPLHQQVLNTPLERLFIETDTPYLTPHPHRGKTNEPGYAALVGEKVAAIKQCTPEIVALQLQHNFSAFFNIPVSE